MRKNLFSLLAFAAISFVFVSCENDLDGLEQELQAQDMQVEEIAALETYAEDVDDQVAKACDDLFNRGLLTDSCATISFAEPQGVFPNTITVDYGDGCTGPNGRTRYGMIIITVSDSLANAGAIRTATSVDFFIDDIAIEFTRTLTNNGLNDEGKPSFTKEGNILATFPDGSTASRSGTRTRTQIKGANTEEFFDDVFTITGSASGVGKQGNEYASEIIQPLLKKRACPWISGGILELTKNGNTALLNFGDGDCDHLAVLTKPDGSTRPVNLKNH